MEFKPIHPLNGTVITHPEQASGWAPKGACATCLPKGACAMVHSFGDLPSKKMKKVNVCLGGQKISMLNKTKNKGREPAGIYSKS